MEPWEERAHRFKQVWAWWREPDAGGKRTAWETILGHLTAKYSTSASLRRLFEAVQQHIVNGVLPCQKNGRGVYQAYADKSRSRLRCNDRTCRHILSQFQVLEYFTQLLLQAAIPSTVIVLRPAIFAYRVPCNNPTTTDHNPASQLQGAPSTGSVAPLSAARLYDVRDLHETSFVYENIRPTEPHLQVRGHYQSTQFFKS